MWQHRVSQPLPERSRHPRAPLAAVWPAWSVGRSLPPKHNLAQVRRPTLPAGLHATSAAVPASMPHRADRAAGDGAGPHGTRLDPVVTVARPYRVSPIATTG
jgi:hypothetical protein